MWKWLWITADDVWLFRDGRPFSAAVDHTARSIFPPTPITMQGAIRATLFGQGYQVGGYGLNDLGGFQMVGPFVARHTQTGYERLLPLPADVVADENGFLHVLKPMPQSEAISGWSGQSMYEKEHPRLSLLWPDSQFKVDTKSTSGRWISENVLSSWEDGLQLDSSSISTSALYQSEYRVGIGMDYGLGRAKDERLYRIEFIRPAFNIGLLVGILPEMPLPKKGKLSLGGEHRTATYEVLEDYQPSTKSIKGQRLKVTFLTPAYLHITETNWSQFIDALLVGAALHSPISIGGWNAEERLPLPMYQFMSPGSVLYFEADRDIKIKTDRWTEAPSPTPQANELPFADIGFGQILVSTW